MKIAFNNSADLANTVKGLIGSSVCSMELTTIVKTNKKSRATKIPFAETFKGEIFRSYKEFGNFNWSYENAVNNQRDREGVEEEFTAKSLPWGEWLAGGENKVISHKGSYYLRYYTGANANSKADKKSVYHYEDGTPLTDREINLLSEFTPPKKKPSTTQGVQKQVEPKVVKMNGIAKLIIGGTTYIRK